MMRLTYQNQTKQHNHTMNPHELMAYMPCFSTEHRNPAQQSKKLNYTLASEIDKQQNKRVLLYELIR